MSSEKCYVRFFSPGTMFSEESCRPIDSWNIAAAVEMANGIKERHAAKPYGFKFVTMLEHDPIPDGRGGTFAVEPKQLRESAMHHFGGKILRYDDVPDDQEHSILRGNMRCNDMPLVIENRNSWRHTGEFKADDVVVEADGSISRRGSDPDLKEYREKTLAAFQMEREKMMAEWATKQN